jgi:microcystin-dependent protein
MATDGQTANYGWVLPAVGGSAASWGTKLNTNLGLIDGQVHANQQAIAVNAAAMIPIGGIIDYVGATAPANYLICDGSQHSSATYPTLSGLLGGTGGVFNVPNLLDRVVVGAGQSWGAGTTGGESAHQLSLNEMPAHTHGVTDPEHYHNVNDTTHNHSQSAHAHTATQDPHTHGYTINNVVGGAGLGFGQNYTVTGQGATTSAAQPNVYTNPSNANINPAATGIQNTQSALTNISIQNAGGNLGHNNMPPFMALNKIIRAL